jgi:putative transposase
VDNFSAKTGSAKPRSAFPGSANLPIGGVDAAATNTAAVQAAARETHRSRSNPSENIAGPKDPQFANREIGAPREPRAKDEPPTKTEPREKAALGWHSRGYLPHFEGAAVTQHVTFRLADSLPHAAISRMESEIKSLPEEKRDTERRKLLEAYIDAGHGCCILRNPAIAEMVQSSLLTFDAQRYRLLAWVVMPNHVHVLFQPIGQWTVASVVASWKKFTARKISDHQGANAEPPSTPVWQREYWDRYIRDAKHLERTIEYIHSNPVKAGLCVTTKSWRWSSAFPGSANLPIGGVSGGRTGQAK